MPGIAVLRLEEEIELLSGVGEIGVLIVMIRMEHG